MRISVLASLVLFSTVTAFGGVVYDYETVITAPQDTPRTYSGTMTLDGAHVHMAVARGDRSLYKDGNVILSSDGGVTQLVLDPTSKTYYELSMSDVLDFLKRTPMKPDFGTPEVSTHADGDGGVIEGMPTRKVRMEMSTTMTMSGMGRELSVPVRMTFVLWMTDRIDAGTRPALLGNGVRTGIEALDKLVDASPTLSSGFPLKSTMTQHFTIEGQEMVTTMTYTATNVRQPAVDKTLFAVPAQYRKVPNPLGDYLKEMGVQ